MHCSPCFYFALLSGLQVCPALCARHDTVLQYGEKRRRTALIRRHRYMDEARVRHLEMIQGVISRLGQNSFMYKGWAVTLVAGILALAAAQDMGWQFVLVALLPTAVFWGLDGYYLRQERLFRKLYDAVRHANADEWDSDAFCMDTAAYAGRVAAWPRLCWSGTVAALYVPMAALVIAAALVARSAGG